MTDASFNANTYRLCQTVYCLHIWLICSFLFLSNAFLAIKNFAPYITVMVRSIHLFNLWIIDGSEVPLCVGGQGRAVSYRMSRISDIYLAFCPFECDLKNCFEMFANMN